VREQPAPDVGLRVISGTFSRITVQAALMEPMKQSIVKSIDDADSSP
jgi:hypothetical protein